MLQVLQWMREARRHIEGETISNCWVKSEILPPVYENELRGDANRKVKRGVAHFQQDFDALASDLSSMNIADAPTAEEILTMPLEVVVDAAKRIVGKDEGEQEIEIEDTAAGNEDDNKEDKADDKLIEISLTKAKEYAIALHHFVVNNIDQPRMLEMEEVSLKLSRAIYQLVDCSSKKQKDISSFFPIVSDTNQQNNDERT